MAVAGLALLASLAVLAFMVLGPLPPLPFDTAGSAARGGGHGAHHVASGAARARRPGPAHVISRPPVAPEAKSGELPFEEHLPSRETASQGTVPVVVPDEVPEVRGAVVSPSEPAGTPAGAGQAPAAAPATPESRHVAAKGPRMVVVIDDIGDHPVLERKLMDLPFPVTLAILPHRPHTQSTEALAASRGIEILLHQPMQPISYPRVNPGPGAVFTDMDARRIQNIVAGNLNELPHVVGINNHMGSAFTSDPAGMAAVMPVLKARGLFFMDSVTSPTSAAATAAHRAGVSYYRRAVFLDNVRHVRAILAQLKTAERHALKHGRAVAIGHPYGETLQALRIWARERDPRVSLVTLQTLGPEPSGP